MPRAIISPSVLASDFGQLTAECKRMIKNGADWLHMGLAFFISPILDTEMRHPTIATIHRCNGRVSVIRDHAFTTFTANPIDLSHFVPNITMGAPILKCVARGVPEIFMDCHMMVSKPEQWVDAIADAGGKLYCFHMEATSDAISLIKAIHRRNMKAGVAISPDTPSTAITDEIGHLADVLLVMTVYPGKGGQKFLERCVPKVSQLRARFPDKDIEVDGGVTPDTVGTCAEAGSNVIVAGTAIFGSDDPENVITALKSAVNHIQDEAAGRA